MILKLIEIIKKDWVNFNLKSDCETYEHSYKALSFCTRVGSERIVINHQTFKISAQERNLLHNAVAMLNRELETKQVESANAYLDELLSKQCQGDAYVSKGI